MTSTTNRGIPSIAGDAGRYKLHTFATCSTDLVVSLGGLLFDAVMSGWEVTAAVRICPDDRPLRLLGVDVTDSPSLLGRIESADAPCVVAVAADLYLDDQRVREYVGQVLEQSRGEIIIFGDIAIPPLRLFPVERICSHAAQVFKSYAVSLTVGSEVNSPTETFSRSGLSRLATAGREGGFVLPLVTI